MNLIEFCISSDYHSKSIGLDEENEKLNNQLEKYKEVIDKAIGYINKNSVYFAELHKHGNYFINVNVDKLLDILKEVE